MSRVTKATDAVLQSAGTIANLAAQAELWTRNGLVAEQARLEEELARISQEHSQAVAADRARHSSVVSSAQADLKSVSDASGALAAPWAEFLESFANPSEVVPEVLRLGEIHYSTVHSNVVFPALMPFRGGRNLVLRTPGAERATAAAAIESALLRLVISVPPGKLRMLLVDPAGLGSSFPSLLALCDIFKDMVTTKPWSERNDIDKQLANVSGHMEMVIQKYLQNRFRTMEEYNESAGEVAEPYRVLAIANFPVNFSDEACRRLSNIMTNGPRCGVYTLLSVDTDQPKIFNFDPKELEANSHVIAFDQKANGWKWQFEFPSTCFIRFDRPAVAEATEALIKRIGETSQVASRVELAFSKIAPEEKLWWAGDTTDSVDVAIGGVGADKPQRFCLGEGTVAHALAAGRTGSGKSTLLHVLIMNLALTYSPEELELYLIDFKKGVEFADYVPRDGEPPILPHAKVIAVQTDREFAISCLEALERKMEERGKLFTAEKCNSVSDYRRRTGHTLPRTVLIVDEFHVFFSEDDAVAQRAAMIIDHIARQGRSFGVHMVLVSQTLPRSNALKAGTLDQMKARIALQCSEADSRLILADDNAAARLLTRAGEGVYNDSGGLKEANTLFQVAWVSDEEKATLLSRAVQLKSPAGKVYDRPVLFQGDRPASVEECEVLRQVVRDDLPQRGRGLTSFVGKPVAIGPSVPVRFSSQAGSNLLLVGRDERLAVGMLSAATAALMAQTHPDRAKFFLLQTASLDPDLAYVAEAMQLFPHEVQTPGKNGLPAMLQSLCERIDQFHRDERPVESRVFVIGFGIHRNRDLRQENAGWSDQAGIAAPVKLLNRILREGPECGIHLLAWWDSYQSVARTLDRTALSDFGARVVMTMPADESSRLIDKPAAAKLDPMRAYLWSEDRPDSLQKFIPFDMPSEAWLKSVAHSTNVKFSSGLPDQHGSERESERVS